MNMDRSKTGALVAAARKEKGWTQRDLARRLHVSDRAVSKWERGAGFPDVSLLEPLAAALDLHVLDLLRGERTAESDVHAAVGEALAAVQEKRRRDRRELWWEIWKALPLLAMLWCVIAGFGMARLPLDRTVMAGVYQNGRLTAVTEVQTKGWVVQGVLPWDVEYQRWLIVPLDRTSGRVRYRVSISSKETVYASHKSWSGNITDADKPFIGDRFYLTRSMKEFAFDLTDGTVIATSMEAYVCYVNLYGGIPLPEIK